ncbi:methyltransferase family protein [Planktotalea frisia]|uniref:Putative S-adenosyl-L-methionine-dependent methyltransferase TehB n=1 Tax=Planktotalea frisia TaxID=696762 RepID=A0A1L9NYE5_9RHOB|nr:class I SAM-dependent methyltransferase [Planktotalea frisia]OJI94222.1 putative S-adenosyl-L-methionine-dependent methyltransferase TehB [Planktotalea frisia]PZX29694.1 methyltransferase family protein [Planktotalea frisia]
MGYDYDASYKTTPQALGAPNQLFVDVFQSFTKAPLRVLDVGCGQGRDALHIARLGHSVVGIDLSPSGVADMCRAAATENLDVEGRVADITEFVPEGVFDVVLIDRTLHMLAETPRLFVLARLIQHVVPKGRVLIEDERSNIAGFKTVLQQDESVWDTVFEKGGTLFVQKH